MQKKIDYFKLFYEDTYKGWHEKHVDDRQLFCNMYEQILEALESVKEIDNAYIKVAINHKLKKDSEILDNIMSRF